MRMEDALIPFRLGFYTLSEDRVTYEVTLHFYAFPDITWHIMVLKGDIMVCNACVFHRCGALEIALGRLFGDRLGLLCMFGQEDWLKLVVLPHG